MKRLIFELLVMLFSIFISPITASGQYTFGEWISDQGYSPGDTMPETIMAQDSLIASLNGIDEYYWYPTKEINLYLNKISIVESNTFTFCEMIRLETLILHHNEISSIETGAFNGLPSMELLDLSNNHITSIDLGDFDGLSDLQHIGLVNNPISNIEPGALSGLTSITELLLGGNELTEIKAGIFNGLSNLRTVGFGDKISKIESGAFIGLSNVTWLRLAYNQISHIESGDFDGLTNLVELSLSFNRISTIEPGSFEGLSNLTNMQMYSNRLSSIEPGVFGELTNLEYLQLDLNPISYLQTNAFCGLRNLKRLDLQEGIISHIETDAFCGLTNLAELYLKNNLTCNIEPGAFRGIAHLESLDLGENTNLKELNLSDASFMDLVYFNVRGNTNINSVSLRNTLINQSSLNVLLYGGDFSDNYGIVELGGITKLDISGFDFSNIQDWNSLYVFDDLTDLWFVHTSNISALKLDVLLNNLDTIQGTTIEGVLHLSQSDFDYFNSTGDGLLAAWDAEPGHHVAIVSEADFNHDSIVNSEDYVTWHSGFGTTKDALRREGDADGDEDVDGNDFLIWQQEYGSGDGLLGDVAVPEPASIAFLLALTAFALVRYQIRRSTGC